MIEASSITLSKVLKKDCNNFDLVRLICACMVIYGHAFAVSPEPGKHDLIYSLAGVNAAAIAVKVFFFLSGILVTNSIIEKKSLRSFLIARFFRIWPALILVLVFSALVIGPVFTNLDLKSYFSNPNTFLYIKHHIFMQSWGTQSLGYYDLPGVFTENPIKNNVNVPLWSLVVEICAYIMIAALFCVGLLKKRLATILFALVILDSILPERILFPFLPKGNEDYSYLPFCFSIGALMAVYKEEFLVSAKIPIGFLLLLFIFSKTEYARYFFYLSLFTGIVYVFSCKPLLRIKLPVDVSYGVYLWGWPIQQVLASIFPSMGVLGNQVFGIILALIFGCFSWYLVEKRSIEYGRELIKCFSGNRLILDFYSKNK